jgi:hypothetical protein
VVPFKCDFCRKISIRKRERMMSRTLSRTFDCARTDSQLKALYEENAPQGSLKPAQRNRDLTSRLSNCNIPTQSGIGVTKKQPFGGEIRITQQIMITPKNLHNPGHATQMEKRPSPRSEFSDVFSRLADVQGGLRQ